MEDKDLKQVVMIIIASALAVLAFIIIRPIFIAIVFGVLFGYIFYPFYLWLHKLIKSSTISALLVVLCALILIILPIALLIPVITNQMYGAYLTIQNISLSQVLKDTFPALFHSASSSANIEAITSSFISDVTSWFLSGLHKLILNFPSILLQIIVALFTFFFLLKDYEKLKSYFLSISPLSKDSQDRFIQKFTQITNSLLYGQIITGLVQGLVAGIGYFIFGVPNALLLTLLTILSGIIIGAWPVWISADIYLFAIGKTSTAIGLLIYGLLIVNWIDNVIRPLIISRVTKMNSAITLIGMIGGLFVFGLAGLLLGPLILAYLLLMAEFYKERKFKSILIEEKPSK